MLRSGPAGSRDAAPGRGAGGGVLAFGPFQLDPRAKDLRKDGVPVPLPVRYVDLLYLMASRPSETIAKDVLIEAVWPNQPIDDNSLAKAVSTLRAALDPARPDRYIVTDKGRGYRFVAAVAQVEAVPAAVEIEALIAPHRCLMDGRAALETLDPVEIARVRKTLEPLVARHDRDARFHVALATACALAFESTRAGAEPDIAALRTAHAHATRACALDPDYGEAWATLGFVLERTGSPADAQAALSQAIAIERGNWLHHLRFASASFGERRLVAARQTLVLMHNAPLARVLAATVFIARDSLAEAEREIDAGLKAMSLDSGASPPLSAVAIHWLKGALCSVRGADDEAMVEYGRELGAEARGLVYATECCASTWYAVGACHLRRGDAAGARAAFEQAIQRVPGHAMAHAGMALLASADRRPSLPDGPASVDRAMARAALLVANGHVTEAAAIVAAALDAAPPGSAGWLIPIDPLLRVHDAPDAWAGVLTRLRRRAM